MTLLEKIRLFGSKFKPAPATVQQASHPSRARLEPAIATPMANASERFKEGIAFHQAGQIEQAQSIYKEILQAQPEHADSWHFLGVIAMQSNDLQGAVECIGKSIAINPNNAVYYINHGNALRALQQLDAAVASFDRALAIKPDFADAYTLRGNTLQDLKQLHAAIKSFDQALALNPKDIMACYNRGNALKELQQLEAAIASFDQAIAIEPQFAEAFVNRGLALQELKQHDAAVASFGKAIAIRPEFAEAYFNRGLALQECTPTEAHLDEVIKMFGTACQLLPDIPQPHLCHARALARAQRIDEAEAAARRALAADPVDSHGAGMFLAGLGAVPMPERIPDALLHALYNAKASIWDSGANAHYQGAELVANALLALQRPETLDILDAGCGTGMVGMLVRKCARRLDGVDMSQPMLHHAKEKGIYDALVCGDLVTFLAENPKAYDAVLSAATLIHFASLRPIFEAASIALRPNGLFIFTVFPNEKDSDRFAVDHLDGMAQGGCYVHGREYLQKLAKETGFTIKDSVEKIHEYEANGAAKMCILMTLCRQA